jgi:hypothetical protein
MEVPMRLALLGLLTLSIPLSAVGLCGDFGGSIDYIYWKPADSAYNFGSIEVDGPDGSIIQTPLIVDPTYSSGVRGELWWQPECCPIAFLGRYYWVEARQAHTFLGRSGFPIEVDGSISLHAESIYHAADLLLAYPLLCLDCFEFGILAGGEFLYSAFNEQAFATGGAPSTHLSHTRYSAGGVSVGLGSCWYLFPCLDFFAEARYGMLFGSTLSTTVAVRSTGEQTIITPFSSGEWTREVDFRFGGHYERRCGCIALGLELGWEARHYLDGPRVEMAIPFASSFTSFGPQGSGKAFGGPFVGLRCNY